MIRHTDAVCPTCGTEALNIMVAEYPTCVCGTQMEWLPKRGQGVHIQDSIEGGVLIHHGLCNDDGSPKRYYSRSEIRKAAEARGLVNHVERGVVDKNTYDRCTQKGSY